MRDRSKNLNRSRRRFLKTGAAGLVGSAIAKSLASEGASLQRRMLIKGGTVLTMDTQLGDFATADVLIEGTKIADIKPNIRASAESIDARGMIVMPGLVDAHRHSWQTVFRRAIANADFEVYANFVNALIPAMRPEDVYIGNLLSGIGAIHNGVTCMLDYSHISKSTEIADSAVRGLFDSGVRAVYAYAAPRLPMPSPFPADVLRLKQRFFSSNDQLVTLRLGTALDSANFVLARNGGIPITCDGIYGLATPARPDSSATILEMGTAGMLGPDVTLLHGTGFKDNVFRLLVDRQVNLVLAPMSDACMRGLADSVTPVQGVLDSSLLDRTGLSTDVEVSVSGDLFSQMRAVLIVQRMLASKRWADTGTAPPPMRVRDVLRMATVGGATANGLRTQIGTLTPGKEADIILLRAKDPVMGPLNNAAATVVVAATPDTVDTVIIGGQVKKRRGALVRTDFAKVLRDAELSRDYLGKTAGVWRPDDVLS